MTPVVLKAHFDGREIKLDEPCNLPPNTRLMVTVLPLPLTEGMWQELAKASLARAYGDDEPDYPLGMVAEPPPTATPACSKWLSDYLVQ